MLNLKFRRLRSGIIERHLGTSACRLLLTLHLSSRTAERPASSPNPEGRPSKARDSDCDSLPHFLCAVHVQLRQRVHLFHAVVRGEPIIRIAQFGQFYRLSAGSSAAEAPRVLATRPADVRRAV